MCYAFIIYIIKTINNLILIVNQNETSSDKIYKNVFDRLVNRLELYIQQFFFLSTINTLRAGTRYIYVYAVMSLCTILIITLITHHTFKRSPLHYIT